MKPRHIHVLDRIAMTFEKQGECRVSDVSEGLWHHHAEYHAPDSGAGGHGNA